MKLAMSMALGAIVGLVGLSGCELNTYCFRDCGGASGGGSGGSGGVPDGGVGAFGGIGGGFIDAGSCNADLLTDIENCGKCENRCELPGAFAKCELGVCLVEECAPNAYDLDNLPENGCEYQCPVSDPGPEICDGLDNDCDGLVDGDDTELVPPAGLCRAGLGTPCEGVVAQCDGPSGWSCPYGAGVEVDSGFIRDEETLCDGLDGDCDGVVDEPFPTLGIACDNGGTGECLDAGEIACDPADATKTLCDLSVLPDPTGPTAELCNGLDDDCNGAVDDGIVFDQVTVGGTQVDRYEASRPDATSTSAGVSSLIACTAPSVLPWTAVTWADAQAACVARGAGYRLCTAAELLAACQGGGATAYPYGASYDGLACNGYDYDGVPGGQNDNVLVPAGTATACSSADGIADLSGNAAEWTSTKTGETNTVPKRDIYQLHGGSYLSPEQGLSCSIALAPRAGDNAVLQNIGFRCCKDP